MKKRLLFVLIAVVILLAIPAGSLAAGGTQGGVLLEGEESPVVTPTPEPDPTPTEAPTPTEVPTEAPTYSLNMHSVSLYVWDKVTIRAVPTPPAGANVLVRPEQEHNCIGVYLGTGALEVTGIDPGTAKVYGLTA